MCYFCDEEENISHLLFDCTYAKEIWDVTKKALGLAFEGSINFHALLFGTGLNKSLNHLFSIVVYYIYREWLVSLVSLDTKIVFLPPLAKS